LSGKLSKRGFVAGVAAAATLALARATELPVYPRLQRGINFHHMLNWPDVIERGATLDYVWPPFAGERFATSDAELARLRAMGFDFIRLTADPAILIATDGPRRDELRVHYQAVVSRLLDKGFNLVFDLAPVVENPRYRPRALIDSNSPEIFAAYLAMVGRVATALARFPPDRLALELMNEPELTSAADTPRWQSMLEALHREARASAPELPLVLGGMNWNSADALRRLDAAPFADSNVLFTFHYYDPHTFTHQGVENDDTRYLDGLAWPANSDNVREVRDRALERAALASGPSARDAPYFAERTRRLLDQFLSMETGPQQVQRDFDAVARWADSRALARNRILLGEFGCVISGNGTPVGESRLRWLTTVREAAEREGFGWSYWAYKGYGGMELVSREGLWHEDVVDALGLRRL
jgi:hypothetical protein